MDASPNTIASQTFNAGPSTATPTTRPTSTSFKRKAHKIDDSETEAHVSKAKRAKMSKHQALTPAEIAEVKHAEARRALSVTLKEAMMPLPTPRPTPTSTVEVSCLVDWSLPALEGLESGEIEAYELRAPWNPKQSSWDQIKNTVRARDATAPGAAEAYRKRFWTANRAVFLATGKYYTNSLPGLGTQRWKHALVPEIANEKKETSAGAPESRSIPITDNASPLAEWYSFQPDPPPAHHVEVTIRATKYSIQNHTRLRACEFRCLPRSFPGWNWHKIRSIVDYQSKIVEEVVLRKSGRKMKRIRYLKDLVPNYFPGSEDDQGRFPNHPGYRLGEDWEPEVIGGGDMKTMGSWVDPFVDRSVGSGERELAEFLLR